MSCKLSEICGGCCYREMDVSVYRQQKEQKFIQTISSISSSDYEIKPAVFIEDGCRRRATFAFEYKKKQLILGFNRKSSHEIVELDYCPSLTSKINNIIPFIKRIISAICEEPFNERKGKKNIIHNISKGDVSLCQADNGIDVVLEFDVPIGLNQQMIIAEMIHQENSIIRISHRTTANSDAETIVEKTKPYIKVGRYSVYIPAGTFLQPSQEGQNALGKLVIKYFHNIKGNVADLFCGVGTFSYLLADIPDVRVTSIDSSASLLKGFCDSINANQIKNITVHNKNLFKYPLDEKELKNFKAVLFDPPRAGAKAVCEKIALSANKPDVIVAISCNPSTFVNDANSLIRGGYTLQEITMIDQFTYSNHSELVAFFTKNNI
ncbi:MAG: class I SAM-dependent RNA methyltransferase [Alphaproteobacteria bacterium]|nr:class I SAM-dependent RNA methyltransferase [Alphaproteobacteria bacterium]